MGLSSQVLAAQRISDGQSEKAEADGQQNYVQHGFALAFPKIANQIGCSRRRP
jgi:hypothetical protein